jgi:hypothetical protein
MILCTLEDCVVTQDDDRRVHFTADMDIDADGSPHAYNPHDTGLDALACAGHPGNWWGVVTDRHGVPVVQGPMDPAPGYYISPTAYQRAGFADNDTRKYLDAETIPFIVIEGFIRKRCKGIALGCRARVTYMGVSVEAMVGDIGPLYKIGEGSIALARALGINSSPRSGGIGAHIVQYELWPGTPAVINGETFPLISA